jgi:hypothetical protein
MGNLGGPENMSDICRQMIPRGMTNRGFAVFGTVMAAYRSLIFVN